MRSSGPHRGDPERDFDRRPAYRCAGISEGAHGLTLYDDGDLVDYGPYENLRCVAETGTRITSSGIDSVGYLDDEGESEIACRRGGVYQY
jgi:hypothetical protein